MVLRTAALALALSLAAGAAWGASDPVAAARAYLARIEALNHRGPRLNAVIAVNPRALDEAAAARGPLAGMAVLLKDSIESADGTATTAGSLALKDNVTGRDAPLVARLKAAGGVVLGKANLSEWANFRSSRSISGWSAVGGLVRNPYGLDRSACGSSAGSAAAVAAGMAAAAIGAETDGSITCPASMNGVVGLKPTVGLVSRSRIVPISESQDTAGPIARTVREAALLLTAIAGSDPADPATREADARKADYAAALDVGSLKGARLGVLRATAGRSPGADAVYAAALEALKAAGATLVEVAAPDETEIDAAEGLVLRAEFKAGLNAYLAAAPPAVKARTLAELIAFNAAEPRETALFGQELFLEAQTSPPLTDPAYIAAREKGRRLAGPEGIDRLLAAGSLDALVAITNGPASLVDPVNGGVWLGSPSTLPAVAGYPHLTVPMGQVSGLPVGLSFIGTAWSEARLLSLGYAFEQATHARRDPTFPSSTTGRAAFDP
jgi:amidase